MTSNARDSILARAGGSGRAARRLPAPRAAARDRPRAALVALFLERSADYGVRSTRVTTEADIAAAVAERAPAGLGCAVPPDMPTIWLGRNAWRPEADCDLAHGCFALTGCALAIAETGTVVFDGGPRQGSRLLTLLPDVHLCVVFEDQIVESVSGAIAALAEAGRAGRPLTMVSGPSATSDIEFVRIEGVHGPRTLEVLLVGSRAER